MKSKSTLRVGLFVTCLVDLVRPRIGFATLKLLQAAGCEVIVPNAQTCCGQPGYNSGDLATARSLALKLVTEFEACDYVVLPSGSCTGMIRVHYPKLFENDPTHSARIEQLAARTYELTEFLTQVVKLEKTPNHFRGKLTYHDACSGLRELGIRMQPRTLLKQMPDAQLVEMSDAATCCGFGGTFSNKYGEISARMAERKCDAVTRTGADAVIAGDLGCLLNIEGRLRRMGNDATEVLHIAEILANESD